MARIFASSKVTIANTARSPFHAGASVQSVLKGVKAGFREIQTRTRRAHKMFARGETAVFNKMRLHWPVVRFGGLFTTDDDGTRTLRVHSGFVCCLLTGIKDNVFFTSTSMAEHGEVAAAFVDVAGTAVNVVFHVSPTPTNAGEHAKAFKACSEYLIERYPRYTVDDAGKHIDYFTYRTYDKDAVVNPDASPVYWKVSKRDAGILSKHKAGESVRGIAKPLGMSAGAVHKIITKHRGVSTS